MKILKRAQSRREYFENCEENYFQISELCWTLPFFKDNFVIQAKLPDISLRYKPKKEGTLCSVPK